jgi:hypothetical protein
MRFLRSTWLQRIFVFQLLVLLNAGPFDVIEQQGDGKDEVAIHAAQFLAELSSPFRQPQIKYSLDAVIFSVVTIFKKVISEEYIPGTSFDPLSVDLLTCPSRGPPRPFTIL